MKKLVTILAIMSLAPLSWAQSTRVMHLMPSPEKKVSQERPNVFINPPKYAKPFKPLAYDDLTYFDPVDDATVDLFMPGLINLSDRSDTLIGYGVHFTSPYSTRLYLDSVTVRFAMPQISSTLSPDKNYIKIKAIESRSDYVFYPNNGDTIWLPLPNHATPSGSRKAKDSLVIKDLTQYVADDPQNAPYMDVTFKMNHKPITTLTNPDFYIEFMTAYDTENPDFENQNQIAIMGDDHEYGGTQDFSIHRTLGLPIAVEYASEEPTDWWKNIVPWAGITNNDHPDPGFYSNAAMIAHVTDVVAQGVEDIQLEGDALAQNYPNPFNPSTNIAYSLATSGQASLKVYNALGNEVASLLNGYQTAGKHEVMFDASELPSGTYYYTLKIGAFTSTKRMVLSK